MPQFALYQNKNAAIRGRFPLLLDTQSDLLDPPATRVVVPLSPAGATRSRSMQKLTPMLTFEGQEYLMLTPHLAGIPTRELGALAGDLATQRAVITAAVDFLISGI